ncbi:MAG: ACT domain-containing protein [Dehalococcoidia bacterium]
MRIKQVSVFVGNETGRLVDMLEPLARSGINILALSVADSADFGIVRLVTSDTEGAVRALHDAGFTLRVNEVLSYEMPNVPGGLLKSVAEPLARADINLEYFYAFVRSEAGKATFVLKVYDLDRAEEVIEGD